MNDYPEILILGRDTCEDTIRSRGHLDSLGIPYVYRSVEIDPDADAWNRSYNGGSRVTPVILVGDPKNPTAVLIEPSDAILEETVTGVAGPALTSSGTARPDGLERRGTTDSAGTGSRSP